MVLGRQDISYFTKGGEFQPFKEITSGILYA